VHPACLFIKHLAGKIYKELEKTTMRGVRLKESSERNRGG
jgi:hypothetical protein